MEMMTNHYSNTPCFGSLNSSPSSQGRPFAFREWGSAVKNERRVPQSRWKSGKGATLRRLLLYALGVALLSYCSATGAYTALTEALKNPTTVKSLDLSGKGLTALPVTIAQLTNLEKLNLSNNKLIALPKELYTLKKLRSLNLTANRLPAISSRIATLKNLEELEISFNPIKSVPKEIGSV